MGSGPGYQDGVLDVVGDSLDLVAHFLELVLPLFSGHLKLHLHLEKS